MSHGSRRFSIRRNWKVRRNKGTPRRKSGSDLSRNRQIVRCRLFIYLYRRRNPAWRNLDCAVQWYGIIKDGDTVGVWAHGRERPTGSSLKVSWRGGVIWQASSPTFARLNSLPGVWEMDIDQEGNFHLKVWEWK